MKEIWLLTSGSYSDYSVECACATEKLANALCERENAVRRKDHRDELQVESFPLLEEMPGASYTEWAAAVWLNPDLTICRQNEYSYVMNPWEEPAAAQEETANGLVFTARGPDRDTVERLRAEWVAGKIKN